MSICGIYKITNNLNNKTYIGKSVNIIKRWNQHKNALDSTPIHQAIQKYGLENFSFEIIEECSKELLDEREVYWIKYYNTCYGYGYNATTGGDGASHPVSLNHQQLLEIIDKLKNSHLSIIEIAKQYNVSTKTISDINNGYSRILIDITYPIRQNNFKKFQISKEILLKLLQETQGDFDLIANNFNVSSMTIRNLCKEYSLPTTRKEYGWEDKQLYHSAQVLQCDKDNHQILQEYSSIRQAAKILGINPNSISKALSSKTHISSGYYWIKK